MRSRYLRPSVDTPQIYLYRAPVDFRKQVNGLATLIEQELGHSPFTGALYAFTNRHYNKIKCLMWEEMASSSITSRWPRRSSNGRARQMTFSR